MSLILFKDEKFNITTTLTPDQINDVLQTGVEKDYTFRLDGYHEKPYYGFVSNTIFRIKKYAKGQNSFLPEIVGEIKQNDSGSNILVVLKLTKIIKYIVYISLIFLLFFTILLIIVTKFQSYESFMVLTPIIVIFGLYFTTRYFYRSEINNAKNFLIDLIGCAEQRD